MLNFQLRFFALGVASAALVMSGVCSAAAEETTGTIELSVLDAATGHSTPARIIVTDSSGGFHVAENAMLVEMRVGDLESPVGQLSLQEAQAGLTRRVINTYNGADHWYSTGRSTIALEPGVYRVTVNKGPEYKTESRDVVVESGQATSLFVPLARWIEMAAEGWYSADAHLHIARPTPDLNPSFLRWMRAEDLNIANCLEWGHSKYFHNAVQYAHGEDGRHQEDHFVIASGQENPRTHFLGHTIILGADSPIDFRQQYLNYGLFWEEARRHGAVSGYAHKGNGNGATGLSIDLPNQLISFLEVIQLGAADYKLWYDILNSGFRMTPVAGTDFPYGCSHIPGRERFYTKIDAPFSFEAWLEGIRGGRTFVTNGPMLEFRVDGHVSGTEIRLDEPGPVRIEATVRFNPASDDVTALEVVENGDVIKRFAVEPGASEIRCEFEHRISEAGWLAVHATGKKISDTLPAVLWPRQKATTIVRAPSDAHAAPVYLSIEGLPTRDRHARARKLAPQWLKRLDTLEQQLTGTGIDKLAIWPSFADGVEMDVLLRDRRALLEAIETAQHYFTEQSKEGQHRDNQSP